MYTCAVIFDARVRRVNGAFRSMLENRTGNALGAIVRKSILEMREHA